MFISAPILKYILYYCEHYYFQSHIRVSPYIPIVLLKTLSMIRYFTLKAFNTTKLKTEVGDGTEVTNAEEEGEWEGRVQQEETRHMGKQRYVKFIEKASQHLIDEVHLLSLSWCFSSLRGAVDKRGNYLSQSSRDLCL